MHAENVRKSFKYLFPDELPALQKLAQSLPPNPVVVNIGAGSGTSGLAFIESRPDLFLWTIDVENNDSPFGSLFSERSVFAEAGLAHLKDTRWFQIHSDSKNVGSALGSERVDLVFIDGDHSYRGAWGDIFIWKAKLKPGGILAVHDYQKERLFHEGDTTDFLNDRPHPMPWPGVNQAVDELLVGKYEQVLFVDSLIAFRIGDKDDRKILEDA